jgi:hypothetical protein
LNKYKTKLGLGDYKIEVVITNNMHYISDRNSSSIDKDKSDFLAEIVRDGYKSYLLVINKTALKNNDLKDTIIHELLHVLMWEMLDECEHYIENVIDSDPHEKEKMLDRLEMREHEIIDKLIGILK